ncbi:MAG: hypothetical protein WAO19_12425 [Candidatus Kryptoniota bacterium]
MKSTFVRGNLTCRLTLSFILLCLAERAVAQTHPSMQHLDQEQVITTKSLQNNYSVDSLAGYSVRIWKQPWGGFEILKDGKEVLAANAMCLDDYYLRRAKKLDSIDIFKGFAMARTLDGPAVGEADGCYSKKNIDSIYEFRNTYGVRCFFIHALMKTYCDGQLQGSEFYHGYFLDITQDEQIQLIQISNTLDMLNDPKITELSKLLVDKIRLIK